MSDTLLAALMLVPFYAATLATDALPRRWRWLPLGGVCVLSLLLFWELARYDHGHAQLLFAVGTIGAPLGAIFGGASWGTRTFYGWPDLGPHPSRLGLWCLAILVGVLVGTRQRVDDVTLSQARGEALRQQVVAWRAAHGEASPTSLAEVAPQAPLTRMGAFAPPAFELRAGPQGTLSIAFPISDKHELRLPVAGGGWELARRGVGPVAPPVEAR